MAQGVENGKSSYRKWKVVVALFLHYIRENGMAEKTMACRIRKCGFPSANKENGIQPIRVRRKWEMYLWFYSFSLLYFRIWEGVY